MATAEAAKVMSAAASDKFTSRSKIIPKTIKLTNILKRDQTAGDKQHDITEKVMNEPFTDQQLKDAWDEFAAQRRTLQVEFQMLSQPFEIKGNQVVVNLLSPVQETMLNNIKVELSAFLREKLKNTSIQISGQLIELDDKKIMYTNRDKFEYLANKNPILKELKDRLGLDTDF